MGRYITLSGILHLLVVLVFMIPALLWNPKPEETLSITPIAPSVQPEEEPEDPPTPTPVPTPDLTKARSLVGEKAPTPTPSPTPSPTSTKKPSPTPSPTATKEKPTATPTASTVPPTKTPTAKPTNTAAPTKTPEATRTPTPDARKTKIAEQIAAIQEEMKDPNEPTPIAPQRVTSDPKKFIDQGGGVSTSVPFGDQGYLGRLSSALQRNFIPPPVRADAGVLVAKVLFKISRDGTISGGQLIESSGHKRVDGAALRAVAAIERFERLPHGTPDLEVTCDFTVE
jgi:TonB family protein